MTETLIKKNAEMPDGQWSTQQINSWYEGKPWKLGCNYINRGASNSIEMWRSETFNPEQINQEMGWMQRIGMNSARVFLHDLAYEEHPAQFLDNVDRFLDIADAHDIKVMPVLWDSVWNPHPKAGAQPKPKRGVHNANWVQSPGAAALADPAQRDRLQGYVQTVVSRYAQDDRIDIWDVANEPDNMNHTSYGPKEPADKIELVASLLEDTFRWIRQLGPQQPLTSGIWKGDWKDESGFNVVERMQVNSSDILTFHCYEPRQGTKHRIDQLRRYERPMLCTEYMARNLGCTLPEVMPLYHAERVGAYNWGLVNGATQTSKPWDTWDSKPKPERNKSSIFVPALPEQLSKDVKRKPATPWFHEIFRGNGAFYNKEEGEFLKRFKEGASGLSDAEPTLQPLQQGVKYTV